MFNSDTAVQMTEIVPPLERVPIEPLPHISERERVHAAAQTAVSLMQLGDEFEITPEDEDIARSIFTSGRAVTRTEMQMPGVVVKLNALLDEYDYALIKDADRIRNYVINRLLEESTDPKKSLRALELLGKVAAVDVFVERKEVMLTHQTTQDIENRLKDSLAILLDVEDAQIEPAPVKKPAVDVSDIDLDDVL